MRYLFLSVFLFCFAPKQPIQAQLHGHSHNDYKQDVPFFKAYYAGMESIEADVFLKNGQLYVAHEEREIQNGRTLEALYLRPLYERFKANGGQPFADASKSLQLVIDIKEDHPHVIPALIKALQPYMDMVADNAYGKGVRIVLSGDMPVPEHYVDYPDFISFDGRPDIPYASYELERVAMISNDMGAYTHWNGKGRLKEEERARMKAVVQAAKKMGKPFRFWATPDSKNTWIELEELGVGWINTDHPGMLKEWLNDSLNK